MIVKSVTDNQRFLAIALMTLGSILISFNGLVLRNIETADNWTIIFYRSLAFSSAIFLYLFIRYRRILLLQITKVGPYGWFAGLVLGISNVCFILSMTSTTVANTVFTISLIPFITAVLAFFILGEKLTKITIYTMITALLGVLIMFYGALQVGEILGNVLALFTAIFFSILTVVLRANRSVDMLPCLLLSGVIAMLVSLSLKMGALQISFHDILLCFLLGGIMSGFVNICFVFASRHLIAAEVTLFFFLEISLSPTWVWLFANEKTSVNTLIGGSVILISLLVRALWLRYIIQKSVGTNG